MRKTIVQVVQLVTRVCKFPKYFIDREKILQCPSDFAELQVNALPSLSPIFKLQKASKKKKVYITFKDFNPLFSPTQNFKKNKLCKNLGTA